MSMGKGAAKKKSGMPKNGSRIQNKVQPIQNGLSERLGLEQALTGIVGGKTGLLMLMDCMLRAAEEHNVGSFQFYAEIYVQKRKELGEKLNQYDRLSRKWNLPVLRTADRKLYETLWVLGKDIKMLLPPTVVTEKQLDLWREDATHRIHLCEGLKKLREGS